MFVGDCGGAASPMLLTGLALAVSRATVDQLTGWGYRSHSMCALPSSKPPPCVCVCACMQVCMRRAGPGGLAPNPYVCKLQSPFSSFVTLVPHQSYRSVHKVPVNCGKLCNAAQFISCQRLLWYTYLVGEPCAHMHPEENTQRTCGMAHATSVHRAARHRIL